MIVFICARVFLSQLDESKDFEERKLIRAAMRDLRKKKRGKEKCFICVWSSPFFKKINCYLSHYQSNTMIDVFIISMICSFLLLFFFNL